MPKCLLCERQAHIISRKLCRRHYEIAKKNGTIPITRKRPEPIDRVMAKVEKLATGCWAFRGNLIGPYGVISHGYRNLYVHRVVFEKEHGPIPNGMEVCHTCDNPPCCNPDHLFLGTQLENIQDKINKGRQTRGEGVGISKLTAERVLEIRASSESGRVLGKRYGVSNVQIGNIRSGKQWRHV